MIIKNKLLITSITAVIVLLIIIYYGNTFVSINRIDKNELTYEQFNHITKNIVDDVISKEYPNYIVMSPSFTIYPGNPDEKWTKDRFNMIDDNTAQPKTITIFVVVSEVITRIDMVFEPSIRDKYYLNVSRTDNNIKELSEINTVVPAFYTNSFTSEGIYYNISTFHKMNDIKNATELESIMIEINTNITKKIQQFLVDKNL